MNAATPENLPPDGLYGGTCEFSYQNDSGKMVFSKERVNRAIVREGGHALVIEYPEGAGVVQVNARASSNNVFDGTWNFIGDPSLGRVMLSVIRMKEELRISGKWWDPDDGGEGDYKFVLKLQIPH